ncbi:hypothetical protein D7S78_12630 [Ralstonia pickettii]|nr:hypothetical protein [Ralstonia pickettii]MBA9892792.1 hypothetical protein [Ralstonia pickettii]MBA9963877.1 hypothetical protein [Ralstonia pickettii]MBB0093110.1 hypothetical protein [Ralstonia pickettii]MBB0102497.1 hypothetical protein [Ralstonia pickettii]
MVEDVLFDATLPLAQLPARQTELLPVLPCKFERLVGDVVRASFQHCKRFVGATKVGIEIFVNIVIDVDDHLLQVAPDSL